MTINRNLSILAGGVSSAGVLGVPNGGSGATTLTGYLIGNGTSAFTTSATIPTSALSGTVNLTSQVSGILPVANGGTGITTSPSNGQIPIGNGTNYTAATLTAGSGISIANASGAITVANTQNTGPAFSYYQSSAQTIPSATGTKITFTSNDFDTTGGMFASSRFTPTVGGYYQVNAALQTAISATTIQVYIYKNGTIFKAGPAIVTTQGGQVNGLIYCNGSTDYIEIYAYLAVGQALAAQNYYTYFQAAMIRGT